MFFIVLLLFVQCVFMFVFVVFVVVILFSLLIFRCF